MKEVSYRITGVVEHGFAVARSSGYPTANLKISESITVPEGIYCALTTSPREANPIPSIVFYGIPHALPFVNESRFEVHLFDNNARLYGLELEVQLISFIRENKKFENDADLHGAIEQDIKTAREYFGIE